MTFKEWITSSYSNPPVNGRWGLLHILTLVGCIAIIVTLALCLRDKKGEEGKHAKGRKIAIWVLVGILICFELARRIINLSINTDWSFTRILHLILPRPWCAIASFSLIACVFVRKKFFYNYASITALLCSLIFFACPGVGFNNVYILFENLYSICTHALLLIISISLITLKFADFKYKGCWKEAICLVCVYIYAILEIFVLKIEGDPLYFMPNGDIQEILGLGSGAYLAVYIIFVLLYINVFYLIGDRKRLLPKKKQPAIENKDASLNSNL
ncbi:MAG: YwaF family protein [Clostridia bacterium]|nr:YwaF family protein [Clostridia bacterium]